MKNISAKAPTPILYKEISFDLASLFKGVAKGIAHTLTQKFDEIPGDAIDILTGFGLENSNEEIAFKLIERSLFSAAFELARDSITHFESSGIEKISGENLKLAIFSKISNIEIELQRDFFLHADKLPLIDEIVPIYSEWLMDMGVSPKSSDSISKRFKSYFVYSLSAEWRRNFSNYKSLLEVLESPFGVAEERLHDWGNYSAMLNRRVNESVFDEPFSLSQIYVPLNAYYIDNSGGADIKSQDNPNEKKYVIDLVSELINWVKKRDREDAIKVLSGGPGSGKSSFTKLFCVKLFESQIAKPIYIPLHLIDPSRDIMDEIGKFVKDEGYLRFNPLTPEEKDGDLVLVFDGLDELANQGRVAAQVAKDFLHAVERMVERRNLGSYPILVLISGRELVVQENETQFRRKKEVFNLLPYHIHENERSEYVDTQNLLDVDYRDQWWNKYGNLVGVNFQGLPEGLKKHEIDEITSQPLLNYLVALSYTRGKLDFDKVINLNTVYADLVAAVYERGYENNRIHKPISHISYKEFFRILEEIGLAAWHGSDGRSTSVNDIMLHCKESGLDNLIKTFKEGAEAGVTKLLAAFFFRKNGQKSDGDSTFVFTHKSFGEYLTAVRISRGIDALVKQLQRRKDDPDDGIDTVEGLVRWAKLVGPAQMTRYIRKFLIQEIEQKDIIEIEIWQSRLTELLSHVIEKQMPMEKLALGTFLNSYRNSNNSSESLVIALNACAMVTKNPISLKFSNATSFGTFLKRVCPQRPGPQSPLLYESLSYFDFSNQYMDMVDFYKANLQYTKWVNAKLQYSIFMNANLTGADLSGALLQNSNLTNANFYNANLKEASLSEAHLDRAEFENANLEGADLREASLEEVNFNGANMTDAVVSKRYFEKMKNRYRQKLTLDARRSAPRRRA